MAVRFLVCSITVTVLLQPSALLAGYVFAPFFRGNSKTLLRLLAVATVEVGNVSEALKLSIRCTTLLIEAYLPNVCSVPSLSCILVVIATCLLLLSNVMYSSFEVRSSFLCQKVLSQ